MTRQRPALTFPIIIENARFKLTSQYAVFYGESFLKLEMHGTSQRVARAA